MTVLGKLVFRLVALAIVASLVVAAVVAVSIVQAAGEDDRSPSDVIVVLGAAQFNGEPQEYLTARLDHAAALFDEGVAEVIMTSGGNLPGDEFTEAEAGHDYLVEHGVPEDAVVPVEVGNDTLASLEAVADAMAGSDWGSAVVVTDPSHSLRARTMLADLGVTAVSSPTRTGPANAGAWSDVKYTARETAAFLAYQVGRLIP